MNNILQMLGAMKNPQAFMNQLANNNQMMQNPMFRNAMDMYRRGDTKGLQELAENLCKEQGTTPEQVQQMLKKQFGL